jgi:hypothetical protein
MEPIVKLNVDPERLQAYPTGIPIRANLHGKWGTYDIANLDKDSLLEWLQSRGGVNRMAEDIVGVLLGHGFLHTTPGEE